MKPAKKPATYEDLCRVPEHRVAEIIDGELIVTPRPASPHALAASGIGSDLWGRFNRDPIARTIEVYRLEEGRWVVASTHAGADRMRAEPFTGVELDISRWWLEG